MAFKLSERTNPLTTYVNHSFVTSVGKVGKTKKQEVYDSVPQLANFSFTGKDREIIIHASNFNYRQLAGQKPIMLGKTEPLARTRMNELLIRLFHYGAIFIIALYHAVFFFVLKKTKVYNLFFAFMCLCWIFRYFLIKDCDLSFLIPALSWELQKK